MVTEASSPSPERMEELRRRVREQILWIQAIEVELGKAKQRAMILRQARKDARELLGAHTEMLRRYEAGEFPWMDEDGAATGGK